MKKMRELGFYGMLLFLSVLASSCIKNNTDTVAMDDEQRMLKQYIITHNITTPPLASGLYYMPYDTGSGITPGPSDLVLFNYKLSLVNDLVIGTNVDSIAKMNNIFKKGVYYRPFEYRMSWWFPGMLEGFQLMREGENARFIIPSKLAYGLGGYPSNKIGSYYTLIYDIELIKVIHDPILYEKTQIEKYVQDNIPPSVPYTVNDSGVYHIVYEPGIGDVARDSDVVDLHYTLRLLDGTLVQIIASSAAAYSFTVSVDQVIPGFNQAIKEMKKGEEALIIIPYKQGYGETSTNVPGFSTLVYNIIIDNITVPTKTK